MAPVIKVSENSLTKRLVKAIISLDVASSIPAEVAVMVTEPIAIKVTNPDGSTVAADEFDDNHSTLLVRSMLSPLV